MPQMSKHWSRYKPGRYMNNLAWFNRPVESILIPKDGIVHELIIRNNTNTNSMVKYINLSTFNNRKRDQEFTS